MGVGSFLGCENSTISHFTWLYLEWDPWNLFHAHPINIMNNFILILPYLVMSLIQYGPYPQQLYMFNMYMAWGSHSGVPVGQLNCRNKNIHNYKFVHGSNLTCHDKEYSQSFVCYYSLEYFEEKTMVLLHRQCITFQNMVFFSRIR